MNLPRPRHLLHQELDALLDELEDIPIASEKGAALEYRAWMLRATVAISQRVNRRTLGDLCQACWSGSFWEADAPTREILLEKQTCADSWIERAGQLMADRAPVTNCEALLQELAALGCEPEEQALLEYQLEKAQDWERKVRKAIAECAKTDSMALKALLRESNCIAVRLSSETLHALETSITEKELAEREEVECSWAQCDGCQKWRRLGNGQEIDEAQSFFCLTVAKTCDEAEDEWDENVESITAFNEGDGEGSDFDDMRLSQRRLLVPGSLVWAQFAYYPFWPAEILDPDVLALSPELQRQRHNGMTLVQFFHTHNRHWIDSRRLVPFSRDNDPNDPKVKLQSFRSALAAASKRSRLDAKAAKKANFAVSEVAITARRKPLTMREQDAQLKRRSEKQESRRVRARAAWRERAQNKCEHTTGVFYHSSFSLTSSSDSGDDSSKMSSSNDEDFSPHRCGNQAGESDTSSATRNSWSRASGADEAGVKRIRAGPGKGPMAKKPRHLTPVKMAVKKKIGGLFPQWFTKLPGAWQTSYADLCEIKEAEDRLRRRMASLKSQEVIKREGRNMVLCAFMGALQKGAGTDGKAAIQHATAIEQALWYCCGSTMCPEYRHKYRILAIAIRMSPVPQPSPLSQLDLRPD